MHPIQNNKLLVLNKPGCPYENTHHPIRGGAVLIFIDSVLQGNSWVPQGKRALRE
jgi:hypothetical protein